MATAEKIIKDIYSLPIKEREKIARHIVVFGIKDRRPDTPEVLDIKGWQDKIAQRPFSLKQAAEYLGVSAVTVRRWIKTGRISAHQMGRAYTFDVRYLKEFKQNHVTAEKQPDRKFISNNKKLSH